MSKKALYHDLGVAIVDPTTYIDKDSSNNMIMNDAVSGQSTLNQAVTYPICVFLTNASSNLPTATVSNAFARVPWNGTIKKVTVLSLNLATVTVDVLSGSYANFNTGTSIFGANPKPALVGARKAEVTTFANASLTAGDILQFQTTTNSAEKQLTVIVDVEAGP
jgi:hypothetical protein